MSVPPRSKITAARPSGAVSGHPSERRGAPPSGRLAIRPPEHLVTERTGSYAPGMAGSWPPSSGVYLWKALASLSGAELELARDYFNNAVNRAYYACYQAAVAALVAEGVTPDLENFWPHDVVHAQFAQLLIDTRGCYPRELRVTLKVVFDERLKADYEPDVIGRATAAEAVSRARAFVHAIADKVSSS